MQWKIINDLRKRLKNTDRLEEKDGIRYSIDERAKRLRGNMKALENRNCPTRVL